MKEDTTNYTVHFGTALIAGCDRVISFINKGKNHDLIRFREGSDGKILIGCNSENIDGHHLLRIENSIVQYYEKSKIINISENEFIKFKSKDSDRIVFEFEQISRTEFKILGEFYYKGLPIIATDEFVQFGTNRFGSMQLVNNGGGISFG